MFTEGSPGPTVPQLSTVKQPRKAFQLHLTIESLPINPYLISSQQTPRPRNKMRWPSKNLRQPSRTFRDYPTVALRLAAVDVTSVGQDPGFQGGWGLASWNVRFAPLVEEVGEDLDFKIPVGDE